MLDPIRLFFRARHRPWCTVFDSRSSFPLNRATNTRAMATSTSALTGADMLAMQRWAVVGDALNEQVRIIGTLSAITRVMCERCCQLLFLNHRTNQAYPSA